jgi:hypothetical protein
MIEPSSAGDDERPHASRDTAEVTVTDDSRSVVLASGRILLA